jgi:predicted nucleic acid-binding protein
LETEAKLFIQEGIKDGVFELVWSAMLDLEIKRSPYRSRQEAFGEFRRISQMIIDIDDNIRHSALVLQSQGLAPADALHVASAVEAGCDYFITVDKGILNKAITEIKTLNPIQFIQLHENDF